MAKPNWNICNARQKPLGESISATNRSNDFPLRESESKIRNKRVWVSIAINCGFESHAWIVSFILLLKSTTNFSAFVISSGSFIILSSKCHICNGIRFIGIKTRSRCSQKWRHSIIHVHPSWNNSSKALSKNGGSRKKWRKNIYVNACNTSVCVDVRAYGDGVCDGAVRLIDRCKQTDIVHKFLLKKN